MVLCRQAWYWRRNWESYTCSAGNRKWTVRVGIAWDLKVHLHSDALPSTKPYYYSKATPPNRATPFDCHFLSNYHKRFSKSWQEARQSPGRHGTEEVDEILHLQWQTKGREDDTGPGLCIWKPKPCPSDTFPPIKPQLLQQGCLY